MSRLKRIIRPCTYFVFDIGGDPSKTILIIGSGRSGTTILSSIINFKNQYRFIFEPFHDKKNNFLSKYSRKYISPSSKNPNYYEDFKKILSGNVSNPWVNTFNKKIFAHKRLIKSIRLHFSVSFITKKFPNVPIVFIIRNPFSVIGSKISLGWNSELLSIINQDDLIRKYNLKNKVSNYNSFFDKHLLQWCLENYIALKQKSNKNSHLLFYESLLLEPEGTIKSLFKFLKIYYEKKVIESLNVMSPTSKDKRKRNLLTGYRDYFSKQEIANGIDILKRFKFGSLYNFKTGIPNINKLNIKI